MLNSFAKVFMGNSGSAGAGLDVAEVFSTFLYTGTGSAQTITNGIDLSGEGGMVWIKSRSNAANNVIVDTEQGAYASISTNSASKKRGANTVTAFSSSGFTATNDTSDSVFQNTTGVSGQKYASWTFRKAKKFFDVVTYTGNGSNRTIAHNLGSVPGMILIKQINIDRDWVVYHQSLGTTKHVELNSTSAQGNDNSGEYWGGTTPTSTEFSLGNYFAVNQNNATYVAYLFAHETNDDSIIQCGGYTGAHSTNVEVNLGWQPQFVLLKNTTDTSNDTVKCAWNLMDTMRGLDATGVAYRLAANSSAAEGGMGTIALTSTGFSVESPNTNDNGDTHIYMAIRAPMITPPAAATDVFLPTVAASFNPYAVGFTTDLFMAAIRSGNSNNFLLADRLRGKTKYIITNSAVAELTDNGGIAEFDLQNSFDQGLSSSAQIRYNFKRAKGFLDVVAYNGSNSAQNVSHNLGVVPEMMWIKCRSGFDENFVVYHKTLGNTKEMYLNTDGNQADSDAFNDTTPTNAVFTLGGDNVPTSKAGSPYIAYLFATLDGISKVGTYNGNGGTQAIDCGFSNGARFVMIRAVSGSENWSVFDTERGIIAGNDPSLALNNTAADITNQDVIDPNSSGFTVVTNGDPETNASNTVYIFYAIA